MLQNIDKINRKNNEIINNVENVQYNIKEPSNNIDNDFFF